jgi:hypothetical protein
MKIKENQYPIKDDYMKKLIHLERIVKIIVSNASGLSKDDIELELKGPLVVVNPKNENLAFRKVISKYINDNYGDYLWTLNRATPSPIEILAGNLNDEGNYQLFHSTIDMNDEELELLLKLN